MTGLRIVAATIIVLVHWRGQFGIPVLSPPFVFYPLMSFFFVLSGFVQMYRYSGLTRQQVCSFLGFRIARLWPMHLVSLGFVAVLVPRNLWWNELCTPGAVLAHVFMIHTWLPFLGFRRFQATQAARFAQFFRVSTISVSSAWLAELGLIVAFKVARRNTISI